MEGEFEHQQRDYEQREAILRHENKVLKDELAWRSKVAKKILSSKTHKYKGEGRDIEKALDILKGETRQYQWNYQIEHNRAKVKKNLNLCF